MCLWSIRSSIYRKCRPGHPTRVSSQPPSLRTISAIPRRRPSRLSPLAAHKPKAHPQRRRASTDSDSSATSASQPPTPTYPPRAGARAPAPTIVVLAAGRAEGEGEGEDLARSVGGLVLRHAQDVGDEVKVGGGRWEVGATGSAGTSVASFEWSWPVFAQWAEAAGSA